jgi:hypothetical protein
LEPGNFYFSKGLKNGKQVYTFKGNDNMIVGDTNKSSFKEYVSPIEGHVLK